MSISPVKFIANTPTLENAMQRVEMQFILDGIKIESREVLGYGKFRLHSTTDSYTYEWSHVGGTILVEKDNPYAPKYYIIMSYADGVAKFITAGNSVPAQRATFSENDVDTALADFYTVAERDKSKATFHKVLISDIN